MQKIIPFLRKVTKIENANEYRTLLSEKEEKISVISMKTFEYSNPKRHFISPEIDSDSVSLIKDKVRIAYNVDKDIANKAKNRSNSKSFSDLGKYSFDYYVKMEEIEDE